MGVRTWIIFPIIQGLSYKHSTGSQPPQCRRRVDGEMPYVDLTRILIIANWVKKISDLVRWVVFRMLVYWPNFEEDRDNWVQKTMAML